MRGGHRITTRLLRAIAGDRTAARLLAQTAPAVARLFDPDWYISTYPDIGSHDPLVHYVAHGAQEGRNPHPFFDSAWYVSRHPKARQNPLAHYALEGITHRYATHPDRGFCLVPPLDRPLRILTLLVRHGTRKYPGADERLHALIGRILPHAERRVILVDNSLPDGDNSSWEFSGWDRAIALAGASLDEFDFIHFATDAFEQLDATFPERFNAQALEILRFGPSVAGHIDFYDQPVEIFGQSAQSWIRSSFFFLRPTEVRALGSMVSVRDKSVLFSGDPSNPFLADAPISGKLREYVIGWLTGDGTGQGVTWHSRFTLTPDTLPLFESKATAIFNELMLTERLRSLGCWMADIEWLRGVLDGAVRGRIFESSWREQTAIRSPAPARLT